MAKKVKAKTKKLVKSNKKRGTSGLMKILEGVVIVGALAAVLIKFFKGEKKED